MADGSAWTLANRCRVHAMNIAAPDTTTPRARSVSFDDRMMHVSLSDGRSLSVPLIWFPRLYAAAPDQRDHWELIGQGVGIHWSDLDEDLSVAGLLAGTRPRF